MRGPTERLATVTSGQLPLVVFPLERKVRLGVSCREQSPAEDDSRSLFERFACSRDRTLREELVLRHLPLVATVVHRFNHRQGALEDLLQVGYVALIRAIDRFDPSRGIPFAAYATPTILGEIKRFLRDKGSLLRLPRQVQEQRLAIRREHDRLLQQLGREPTLDEVAAAVGLPRDRVAALFELATNGILSLDRQFAARNDDDCPPALAHMGSEDRDIERVENRYDLARAMAGLDQRERAITYLHFFHDLSQAEIGERLHISQMHVSRLQRSALRRLKGDLHDQSGTEEVEVEGDDVGQLRSR